MICSAFALRFRHGAAALIAWAPLVLSEVMDLLGKLGPWRR